MAHDKRTLEFYILAAFFALFVLFLYGPLSAVLILSFQGRKGGSPSRSTGSRCTGSAISSRSSAVGDFARPSGAPSRWGHGHGRQRGRVASGRACLPRRFLGSNGLFYLTVASLVVPSIIISLGIGVVFQQLGLKPAWYSSGFGAHLTWTLPFGVLIMFAVFNRFSPSYEEAARDLGASSWQTFRHVLLPMIAPSLVGVGLFGFTLSYDEFARTLMTSGTYNTLPLEIYGMTTNVTTPVLYALGTVTTLFSFTIILATLGIILMLRRRQAKVS